MYGSPLIDNQGELTPYAWVGGWFGSRRIKLFHSMNLRQNGFWPKQSEHAHQIMVVRIPCWANSPYIQSTAYPFWPNPKLKLGEVWWLRKDIEKDNNETVFDNHGIPKKKRKKKKRKKTRTIQRNYSQSSNSTFILC